MLKHYPFYDTAIMGLSAQVVTLFAFSEGSTPDKQSQDTNMRIGGQWAQSETFTINRVIVFPDDNFVAVDYKRLWEENFIKVIIEQETFLQIPLSMCAGYAAFEGVTNQAVAADFAALGKVGHGFELKIPIVVAGGRSFKVELHQITTLTNADQNVKLVLDGILDQPER